MSRYSLSLTNIHGQVYFTKNRFDEICIPGGGFVDAKSVLELPIVEFDSREDAIEACNEYIQKYSVERCQVIDNEARELIHTSE